MISDVLKAQCTDVIKEVVQAADSKMVPVPNNWTSYFQPLDISVNKEYKDFMRKEAPTWYSGEIEEQLDVGNQSHEIKVEVMSQAAKQVTKRWNITASILMKMALNSRTIFHTS